MEFVLPDDDVKLGEAVEIALFCVAQETLTNAAKCSISTAYRLHIADDGIGIKPQDLLLTQTHGLVGMRQRVSARGGRFEIEQAIPHGTSIRVSMPRDRAADVNADATALAVVVTPDA